MPRLRSYGFTLIEVVAAVAIIGTMIVATGALLQRIPVSGREVRDQDLALKIARSEMEVLRAAGYDALPASGSFADTQLSSLASGAGSVAVTDFNSKTKQVVVSVSWTGAKLVARSVNLTTLITQNAGI
jgi:prepilin-type N-terminal cleavage/methylation domain-containing protein